MNNISKKTRDGQEDQISKIIKACFMRVLYEINIKERRKLIDLSRKYSNKTKI